MDAKEKADRMIENYAARLRAGQIGCRRDGLTKAQTERYAAGVVRTKLLRAQTGVVLDAAGVPTIVRPFYYSFALKLGKLDRDAWGESAKREEGQILVQTWMCRGLRRDVMLKIARSVFNLDLSGTGPPACAPARGDVESIGD
jgi:hypothetical protein